MKIGLLECDHVMQELRNGFPDYPAMFEILFRETGEEHEFKIFPVTEGVLPESVDECDAYISTGSRKSINEKDASSIRFIDFIRELNERKKKFVGVCFGHQAIALALGGKVDKSRDGWAVGVIRSTIKKQKSWMEPFQESINIIVSHEEEIIHLPSGCELLASNHHCINYMFQYGDHFLGIQGHPEFSKIYSSKIMALREKIIPADIIVSGNESLSMVVDSGLCARWINNFLNF